MKKINLRQLIIICLIIFLNFNTSLATDSIYNYFANGTTNVIDFNQMTGNVLGIITWIGYAIAVCVILITGIQYITATPQKRAQLKEKLWLICIGVIILVGSVSIINLIASVFQSATSTL